MGIDLIAGGRRKKAKRTAPKSKNVYIKLLVQLYRYLARRAGGDFNAKVLHRLMMSRTNRPPLGLRRLATFMKDSDKIAVTVGTVTDDNRLQEVPKMRICALHFTEMARARIIKAGGECLTFDQLAIQHPTGEGAILFRGAKNARLAHKHFGVPGVPHSKTRPYVRSKGRKFEKARGRRQSRGFKV
eukprot:evm.model.scf_109.4 EVM.evm.TU.scf_109.4   scf_109:47760-51525(-)